MYYMILPERMKWTSIGQHSRLLGWGHLTAVSDGKLALIASKVVQVWANQKQQSCFQKGLIWGTIRSSSGWEGPIYHPGL